MAHHLDLSANPACVIYDANGSLKMRFEPNTSPAPLIHKAEVDQSASIYDRTPSPTWVPELAENPGHAKCCYLGYARPM